MPSPLLQLVVERLDAEARRTAEEQRAAPRRRGRPAAAPPSGWEYLVLAALDGPAALEVEIEGPDRPPRETGAGASSPAAAATVEPPGAYLRSITVEGFRGIGPRVRLEVTPGPGLTLVIGRNGSGKSSLAEALELLLTGTSYRWEGRTARWREGWRSLHHPTTALEAEFVLDGRPGYARAWRSWSAGEDLDHGTAHFQEHGRKQTRLADVAWSGPLETYRPFLSYSELGTLLESGQAGLYDALVTILGLQDLDAAQATLATARAAREKTVRAANAERDRLRALVGTVDDERARAAAAALDAAEGLADLERLLAGSGASGEQGALAVLQRLSALPSPGEAVSEAVRDLREAGEALARTAGTLGERSRELADLLDQALRFEHEHGGTDCPVCGATDALGGGWRETTAHRVSELRDAARAASAAREQARRAQERARRLPLPPRELLDRAGEFGLDAAGVVRAADALAQATAGEDLAAMAGRLEAGAAPLDVAVAALRDAAAGELQRRQDVWVGLHGQLARWLPGAREAEKASARVKALKHGGEWLKKTTDELRNERFTPIKAQAQAVWDALRLQSNVSLKDVRLEGSSRQRRVDLAVAVDGLDGDALGVMSQGELHALALSLFIPRATQPGSPFRFLVVDDPVQSMDPARVDGLAQVLHETARRRQVVVFTHDDRLPQSVRRLGLPARLVEVTRRASSVVELREGKDPASRYFDDAMAVAMTEGLDVRAARRVVPGLCRLGLEAVCVDVVRRRRLSRGEPHEAVEDLLTKLQGTKAYVALLLFDDATRTGEVFPALGKAGRDLADTFRLVNEGAHELQSATMRDTVRSAEKLAAWLRSRS